MIQGTGCPVFPGVAIGCIYLYRRSQSVLPAFGGSIDEEIMCFEAGRAEARRQLQTLYEAAKHTVGDEQAMILDVQMMMLDDQDYIDSVNEMIRKGIGAAQAARDSGEVFAAAFAAMDDSYMNARAADVRDMSDRLAAILCGSPGGFTMEKPGVLVADDLTPSETLQLPKDKILAFVTRQGSSNSHMAILARTLGIPSLVQAQISLDDAIDGHMIAVDGFTGDYYIDPDDAIQAGILKKQEEESSLKEQLEAYRGRPSATKKGRAVKLMANIGGPEDVKKALSCDAEGVGLMRSEFLYLGRERFPTEEELYEAYRQVVTALEGRPLVIRTLDIGADKQADYFGLDHEENPALGYRGIRICLGDDTVFAPQMRAIYRAAAHGPVCAMFPMIASVWEVRKAKEFCAAIRAGLTAEGVPFGTVQLGIMVETPAAAICSAELAKEVDFFSVGTNDLTQYTLAVDRQNAKLDRFYDPHHPAVLELLRQIAHNAHAAGIWAGICGELAADLSLTDRFLEMGYDELSVSPGRILSLRKQVCESEVN